MNYCELVKKDENGNIKVPIDLVDIEEEIKKTKDNIVMKYIFQDRSYIIINFTKQEDYILEKGL